MKKKEENIFCLQCKEAKFINPEEICYKTGGLYCQYYNTLVGKYDSCLARNKDQNKSNTDLSLQEL